MARIINVEKSQYLNDNIEIYTKNKVGQYSKFLDKNPLFVTWFHINQNESRTDVGTGGVKYDLGPKSPFRYNQINGLPTYNIPELKPDASFEENGYDVDIEISDGVLLPGTFQPTPGDYLLIKLPNTIEFLFLVNNFSYNTIQSNDYYLYSAHLKYTGTNLIEKFGNQIVEVYETIFENIGTDDKCFLLKEDIPKIKDIGKLFLDMREAYYNNFFDPDTGTFVCRNNTISRDDSWFYDKYVERFIMDSDLYYSENDAYSIMLPCNDFENSDMRRLYMQSLFYAVLNRSTDYLASHPYYYMVPITRGGSAFVRYNINCKGTNLVITKEALIPGHSDALDSDTLHEYFSHYLIGKIKGEWQEVPEEESLPVDSDLSDTNDENSSDNLDEESSLPTEDDENSNIEEIPDDTSSDVEDQETDQPKEEEDNESNKPEDNVQSEKPSLSYVENMVYQYLTGEMPSIDRTQLLPYIMNVDIKTYLIMPLIMYIVMKYYDSYFEKEEL